MSSEITTQGRASQSYTGTFATTHWTRVLAARGDSSEAQAALSELCAAYYQPVVAFLNGTGRTDDDARELAHQFFSRILERNGLDGADPERGRFRSYLLGALKHFLHATREREERQKRGGAHERTIREFKLEDGQIKVGDALREFRGVLTGVPMYDATGGPATQSHDD